MQKASLIFLFFCSCIAHAQTSETKYYRSRPFENQVPKEKAKYSETITEQDGVVTTTVTNLKKDEIEFRTAWRADEPVGKWIGLAGTGPEELDYDFEIMYKEIFCSNSYGIQDIFSNNDALSYTAPVIDFKEPDLMAFIRHKLRYPSKARRNGLQGTVFLAFSISQEGVIKDVVVTKGVDIVLDKEAVRVIRALRFSAPAMLDGQPQEVCIKMPLRFKLS
jgi:TonB family protein